MMKQIKILVWVASFCMIGVSCKKDDLNTEPPVGLGGEVTGNTAIDEWLRDSLTIPYNIAVKYRWDPWELNLDKTLTPPDESKIIAAMSAIKRVWIDPYNAETGSDLFIKTYSPKQFKLVGSVEYNYNGTVLLGQAEGGNNIAFFDINQNFDKDNASSIRRMIQTSHHEFAHILNQNTLYPPEFRGISGRLGMTGYTATWFNISNQEALDNGYITPYSMASADEDFVEMVANMLMEGKARFDQIVSSVNPDAQQAFRSKEQFVVDYFREVWDIDFYSLQDRVHDALDALVPFGEVDTYYGFGKEFTIARVNPSNQVLLPQRPSFMAIYNTAKSNVEAIPGYGLTLDSFELIDDGANLTILRFFTNQGGPAILADFDFTHTVSNGVHSYAYSDASPNGTIIKDAVQGMIDYFSDNQFNISWHVHPRVSIYGRVKFTPVAIPDTYFLALLVE